MRRLLIPIMAKKAGMMIHHPANSTMARGMAIINPRRVLRIGFILVGWPG
jgi:hypothetical protein